jgi:hypothetical protein
LGNHLAEGLHDNLENDMILGVLITFYFPFYVELILKYAVYDFLKSTLRFLLFFLESWYSSLKK